ALARVPDRQGARRRRDRRQGVQCGIAPRGGRADPRPARARGAREALAHARLRILGDAALGREAEARRAGRGRADRPQGARRVRRALALLAVLATAGCAVIHRAGANFWELERGPSSQAPEPATTAEAVLQGDGAASLIPRVEAAIAAYPYQASYRTWPGPNSNTFTAWVGRSVPELRLNLPPTAIGKDFLPGGALAGTTPSGTGVQLSLFGLGGLAVGWEEGIELNLLTLNFGVELKGPALKL